MLGGDGVPLFLKLCHHGNKGGCRVQYTHGHYLLFAFAVGGKESEFLTGISVRHYLPLPTVEIDCDKEPCLRSDFGNCVVTSGHRVGKRPSNLVKLAV